MIEKTSLLLWGKPIDNFIQSKVQEYLIQIVYNNFYSDIKIVYIESWSEIRHTGILISKWVIIINIALVKSFRAGTGAREFFIQHLVMFVLMHSSEVSCTSSYLLFPDLLLLLHILFKFLHYIGVHHWHLRALTGWSYG